MTRNRSRIQTAQPRKARPSRSSKRPLEEKDKAQEASRLKKVRVGSDQGPDVRKSRNENDEAQRAELARSKTAEKVAGLQRSVDDFLKLSLKSRLSVLPGVDLLVNIADLLEEIPIPTFIARLGKVPRVLLIAAKRGIEEQACTRGKGSVALVRSLAVLAKGADVTIPEDDRASRATRSAFNPTADEGFSQVELLAVQRAGVWALRLLTSCVRGEGESQSLHVHNSDDALEHGNTSRIFVAPRDFLDTAMSGRYTSSILERVHAIINNETLLDWEKIGMLRAVSQKLYRISHTNSFIPVVEGMLFCTANAKVPVKQSDTCKVSDILDASLVHRVMSIREHSIFRNLAGEAQTAMLKLNRGAWLTHLEYVKSLFRTRTEISVEEQRGAVQALAAVASEDVARHWELMDNIRRIVSNEVEPFSVNLWKQRVFYRAVLSQIIDNMDQKFQSTSQTRGERLVVTPLSRRFPKVFQPLVRSLSMAVCSMFSDGYCWTGKTSPGFVAMKVLFDTFRIDVPRCFPPNVHAVLLCIEGLLEKLFWAIGYATWDRNVKERRSDFDECKTLAVISSVITLFEVIRLPGGPLAEEEDVLSARNMAIRAALDVMLTERRLPSNHADEWRLNGLLSMYICGAHCASGLGGLQQFCSNLDNEEKKEMQRAIEITKLVSNSRSAAPSVGVHCAELINAISSPKQKVNGGNRC